jgi:two-component system LytT family response regulator
MIRALVVDDELHAREEMKALLLETGKVEVLGTCANAFEALKAINKERPEIVFLDIEMPMVGGFELLNMINEDIMPYVVFVTAFEEFSLKAFEERTLDYLLKPVCLERLQKTLCKAESFLSTQKTGTYTPETVTRVPCLLGRRIKLVNMDEVEFVSAESRGHFITTAEGEYYTDIALKVLEERTMLVRCHKQYLVNMDRVSEIQLLDNGLGMISTLSGKAVPVSRLYLKQIKKALML